jgi:hypothetical protein
MGTIAQQGDFWRNQGGSHHHHLVSGCRLCYRHKFGVGIKKRMGHDLHGQQDDLALSSSVTRATIEYKYAASLHTLKPKASTRSICRRCGLSLGAFRRSATSRYPPALPLRMSRSVFIFGGVTQIAPPVPSRLPFTGFTSSLGKLQMAVALFIGDLIFNLPFIRSKLENRQ